MTTKEVLENMIYVCENFSCEGQTIDNKDTALVLREIKDVCEGHTKNVKILNNIKEWLDETH